ncbi:MAG: hypothetical protein HY873_03090 [Chloroflexi bacterium]|nr:hypothetical protein [Chloroflexota bacterium]
MQRKVRFAGLAVAAVAALALTAVACSDDDGGDAPRTQAPQVQTQTAAGVATRSAGITPLAGVTVASGSTTVLIGTSSAGGFLTDSEGRALYTSANDPDGRSVCLRSCAQIWPPLTIESGSPTGPADLGGVLSTVTREDDGATQVTYNGRPLYRYSLDVQPGDTKGNGIGGNIWVVAVP